ncbi:O-acyltransferase like protein-like [Danaus plexippus]|uniref:O-acyltransferase like protein-like n=1 Tax=Danaus plexippus TaxID=13037 RepID=UPI002AB12212|nr:O-acyltransferase like protein-like [Danaus plexippus]
MKTSIFFTALVFFLNKTNAKISGGDYLDALDRDLHQRVLDPEQCQNQLQYIRRSDPFLSAQFVDAGLRIPKGILQGNLKDYGNYHQCLGIHQDVSEDMQIQGKFCLISVPVNLNSRKNPQSTLEFDPSLLQLPLQTKRKLEERNMYLDKMRSIFGNTIEYQRMDPNNTLPDIDFQLGICIPKVCTTEEALLFNLFNYTLEHSNMYCRLPNDKHWITADYIAIVIFSLLGLLIILSTSYDVYYTVFSKKDPKNMNVLLSAFSAYTNTKRVISTKPQPGIIECLDGIRSLALFWVVFGHVFFIFNFFPANTIETMEWSLSYDSIMIRTALLSVDTFFLMSGILLVYTTAHKLTGCQLLKNIVPFYLNRLLRMFPVLAFVILFQVSIYNRIGDGPMWTVVLRHVQNCRTVWWSTLLHLQNFLNPEESCIPVTWYLAIDVQLHILSPIVLFWVLGRERRLAWSALFLALFLSLTASTAYIFANTFSDEGLNYFVYVYVNILTRAPPFFVGMVFGYALHLAREKKKKMPMHLHVALTAFSISLLALILYCHDKRDDPNFDNQIVKDLFQSFLRPFWAAGLGWIIYACYNGYAGPINWLLSLNLWKIPSRISYAMYLSHLSLILVIYSNALQPLYFSVQRVMFDAMGFIAIALVTSFLITIFVDLPFSNLIKLCLSLITRKRTNQNGVSNVQITNGNLPTHQIPEKKQDS